MENDRKKRLYALKEEQQHETLSNDAERDADSNSDLSEETEGDDINKFIKNIVEQKQTRKKQLEIVQDFFENPASYGVDTDIIPSSTTKLEVEERKVELQHKIDLLHSILKALEGEMQMLCQIKQPDENENTDEDERDSNTEKGVNKK